jgi:hypothetical protein
MLVIAGLLMILGLLLVWLMAVPEPAFVSGAAHPDQAGMSVGGDRGERLGAAGPMLFWLQSCILLLIHALIALGVAPRNRTRTFWALLGLIATVSLAVWWGMYESYTNYLRSGVTSEVFGFPLPTSLALFGVPCGGVLLCMFYVWGFRRFVYSEVDEAAYEKLRAESGQPRLPEH